MFTLDDYVAAGIMTPGQAAVLRSAVAARKNILVAGGTSTGKTTLTNALLAEIAGTADRVVLIEDAPPRNLSAGICCNVLVTGSMARKLSNIFGEFRCSRAASSTNL